MAWLGKLRNSSAPPLVSGSIGKRSSSEVSRPAKKAKAKPKLQDKAGKPLQVPLLRPSSTPCLSAETIRGGKLLATLASDAIRDLCSGEKRSEFVESARTHTYATLCSGTEIFGLCLHTLADELAAVGINHDFECLYMAEQDKAKQKWLLNVAETLMTPEACLFPDVRDLWNGECPCLRHKKNCTVRASDLIGAGISCKSWSKANPLRWDRQRGSVLQSETSQGGSSDTFHGLLRVLDRQGCKILMIENSDELVGDEQADWSIMVAMLQARGYRCQTVCLDSVEFGIPAHRRRAYLIAILMHGGWHTLPDFDTFKSNLICGIQCMRRGPPSALDLLYEPDHPEVQAALVQWQGHQAAPLQGSTVDIILSALNSKKRPRLVWNLDKVACRDTTTISPWFEPLNHRMRKVLADQQFETRQERLITLFDIGQSINRVPRSAAHPEHPDIVIAPTILPGSFYWISMPAPGADSSTQTHSRVTDERFLLANEMLQLQAWPIKDSPVDLSKFKDSTKASLAGNMFTGSVCMAVISSAFFSIPWSPRTGSDASPSAAADAASASEAQAAFEEVRLLCR